MEKVADLVAYVNKEVPTNDVILIQPNRNPNNFEISLPRLFDRPTLVEWKFVPSRPNEIYEWYERIQYKEMIFSNGCQGPLKYNIAYLLLLTKANKSYKNNEKCGRVVWASEYYQLIKVSDDFRTIRKQ